MKNLTLTDGVEGFFGILLNGQGHIVNTTHPPSTTITMGDEESLMASFPPLCGIINKFRARQAGAGAVEERRRLLQIHDALQVQTIKFEATHKILLLLGRQYILQ